MFVVLGAGHVRHPSSFALSVKDVLGTPCEGRAGATAERGGGVNMGVAAAASFCAASPVLSACRSYTLGPAQRAAQRIMPAQRARM